MKTLAEIRIYLQENPDTDIVVLDLDDTILGTDTKGNKFIINEEKMAELLQGKIICFATDKGDTLPQEIIDFVNKNNLWHSPELYMNSTIKGRLWMDPLNDMAEKPFITLLSTSASATTAISQEAWWEAIDCAFLIFFGTGMKTAMDTTLVNRPTNVAFVQTTLKALFLSAMRLLQQQRSEETVEQFVQAYTAYCTRYGFERYLDQIIVTPQSPIDISSHASSSTHTAESEEVKRYAVLSSMAIESRQTQTHMNVRAMITDVVENEDGTFQCTLQYANTDGSTSLSYTKKFDTILALKSFIDSGKCMHFLWFYFQLSIVPQHNQDPSGGLYLQQPDVTVPHTGKKQFFDDKGDFCAQGNMMGFESTQADTQASFHQTRRFLQTLLKEASSSSPNARSLDTMYEDVVKQWPITRHHELSRLQQALEQRDSSAIAREVHILIAINELHPGNTYLQQLGSSVVPSSITRSKLLQIMRTAHYQQHPDVYMQAAGLLNLPALSLLMMHRHESINPLVVATGARPACEKMQALQNDEYQRRQSESQTAFSAMELSLDALKTQIRENIFDLKTFPLLAPIVEVAQKSPLDIYLLVKRSQEALAEYQNPSMLSRRAKKRGEIQKILEPLISALGVLITLGLPELISTATGLHETLPINQGRLVQEQVNLEAIKKSLYDYIAEALQPISGVENKLQFFVGEQVYQSVVLGNTRKGKIPQQVYDLVNALNDLLDIDSTKRRNEGKIGSSFSGFESLKVLTQNCLVTLNPGTARYGEINNFLIHIDEALKELERLEQQLESQILQGFAASADVQQGSSSSSSDSLSGVSASSSCRTPSISGIAKSVTVLELAFEFNAALKRLITDGTKLATMEQIALTLINDQFIRKLHRLINYFRLHIDIKSKDDEDNSFRILVERLVELITGKPLYMLLLDKHGGAILARDPLFKQIMPATLAAQFLSPGHAVQLIAMTGSAPALQAETLKDLFNQKLIEQPPSVSSNSVPVMPTDANKIAVVMDAEFSKQFMKTLTMEINSYSTFIRSEQEHRNVEAFIVNQLLKDLTGKSLTQLCEDETIKTQLETIPLYASIITRMMLPPSLSEASPSTSSPVSPLIGSSRVLFPPAPPAPVRSGITLGAGRGLGSVPSSGSTSTKPTSDQPSPTLPDDDTSHFTPT